MRQEQTTADTWDPEQYRRFERERSQPFFDLLSLVQTEQPARVLDLGCGTGELTATMHRYFSAQSNPGQLSKVSTRGIDNSPAMLTESAAFAESNLTFELGDIGDPPVSDSFDLVFANAALQWVPDHPAVLARWTELLSQHGELAVQVPANVDHASHQIIAQLAAEEPWFSAGSSPPPPDPVHSVLKPEQYAELLFELGFTQQHVRLQVYGHVLESAAAVVQWTKGTTLTRMRRHFTPDVYEEFVAEYSRRLITELGDQRPYFYAFKRILIYGRR